MSTGNPGRQRGTFQIVWSTTKLISFYSPGISNPSIHKAKTKLSAGVDIGRGHNLVNQPKVEAEDSAKPLNNFDWRSCETQSDSEMQCPVRRMTINTNLYDMETILTTANSWSTPVTTEKQWFTRVELSSVRWTALCTREPLPSKMTSSLQTSASGSQHGHRQWLGLTSFDKEAPSGLLPNTDCTSSS